MLFVRKILPWRQQLLFAVRLNARCFRPGEDYLHCFLHSRKKSIPVCCEYESEAKRGTADATYGYYTMGKLMILKLREDYKAKMGEAYSLKNFHDAFIKLRPLPLPLVRKAMVGEVGNPFLGCRPLQLCSTKGWS